MLESPPERTIASPSWPSPPDQLSLTAKDVHIWRASLELPAAIVQTLRRLLSADEQDRADRFYFEKDRRHFTVARGFLRKLLGRYLAIAPAELRFTYAEHGKPQLASGLKSDFKPGLESELARQLRFNLAHSGGLALYAFTSIGQIGIDLE